MFEKEAQYYAFDEVKHKQEWYIKHPERSIDEDYEDIKKHWGKGAEHGYNKANEWHYVKDRLPKELHDVLCFVIHNEHRYSLQGYLRDGRWVLSPLGTYLNNEDVIAWKEIVFPKEV